MKLTPLGKMKNKIWSLFTFSFTLAFSQERATDTIYYKQRTFQDQFQDQYKGDEFNYEPLQKVDSSTWDRFWSAVQRFLRDLFDFSNVNGSMSGLQVLLKIAAIGVILFVIYLIVKAIINNEGGWVFGTPAKKINVENVAEENIHSINFQNEIEEAKRQKKYRIAVRYYYLWLLKSLTDKNIIEWDIEKTNSDYLREIKAEETKKTFNFLSYIYEYSWYGEFELNEENFNTVETAFVKTITTK